MPRRNSETVPITPAVLQWAVENSGLSDREIAEKVRVDQATLYEWLKGDVEPTRGEIAKLAQVLKRPSALFLLPAPPEQRAPAVAFRHPIDSSRAKINAKEALVLRDTARLQRALSWVRQEIGNEVVALPVANPAGNPATLATRIRAVIGVGVAQQLGWDSSSEALRTWRRHLEDAGVYVFMLPMGPSSARGFSLWDAYAPAIAANTHWNNDARIFTLFHELAHLLTRTSSVCLSTTTKHSLAREDSIERWCEGFAAAFLMPWLAVTEFMRYRLGWTPQQYITNIADLRTIARTFKVSLRAAALRLIQENAAQWSLYDTIPKWSDEKGEGGGGGGRRRRKLYEDWYGNATSKTFVEALDDDLMSRADVLSYLKVSDSDLYQIQSSSE